MYVIFVVQSSSSWVYFLTSEVFSPEVVWAHHLQINIKLVVVAPALCLSVCVVNKRCQVSIKRWLLYIVTAPRFVNRHGEKGTRGGGGGLYRYEEGGYVVLECSSCGYVLMVV